VIENKSLRGPSSSGVPGTVAGLFESMKYAKLSMKELIQPAIDLAEKGYVITEREARSLNNLQDELQKYNTMPNAFQKTIPWKAGDTLIQKDLANTLKRIRENGAAGFYEGQTAKLIVDEMRRGGGYISLDDLKNYKAKWRAPHTFNYKGYTIVSMPMPSSGGVLLHQMMKMLEEKPLASYGHNSPKAVQLMVEVERRAYADRAEYMGDPDFYKVPVTAITSDAYLKSRMMSYDSTTAGNSQMIKPGVIAGKQSEETTHLSVIDKEGNAVAVTTTLNDSYGSKTVVGGAGFFLNDEMDDFSAKPGVPNMYGAVGGEANAIAPGKRMLSAMTPTVVLQNGKPFLVVGTPGGTTIPTSVFQTVLNVIEFGMSTEDAVYKPKFHHQWLPDEVFVEKGFPESTKEALKKMGYKLTDRNAIGRVEVIKVLPNGKFEGVADNRGDDTAEGF
jgi:gamma-glutamyltranspeptidase / glutathione hydrolase